MIRLAVLLLAAAASEKRPFTPEELLATRRPDDVKVSPDGRWASVTVRQKSLDENRDVKDIWLLPLSGQGEPRQFTRNGKSEHARWSPDGKSLLVQRDRQLWLYDLQGGDGRQVTNAWGGAESGVFSPDGKSIAFTSEVYPQCKGDDVCNRDHAQELAKTQVQARTVDRLFARHWTEWKDGKRTHLFVQPLDRMSPRDATPFDADWPAWSLEGGDNFVFTGLRDELIVTNKPPEREAWSTNGDLFSLAQGAPPRNLTAANKGDDTQPRLSPDGKLLAWTAQARDGYESDRWQLKVLELGTGKTTVLARNVEDDLGPFAWRRDSKGLIASVPEKGRFALYAVGLDGTAKRLPGEGSADFDVGPDSAIVAVQSGMNRPPEVFKNGARLTHLNDAQYAGLDLGPRPEELWIDAKDGAKVHAFVQRPPGGKKAPLLLLIHGGPQGSWEDAWGMRWNPAAFAARGYVVLAVDPHGSVGYGQAFKESVSGDWGGLPYDDLMRAVDVAERLPYVELGRTCAAGASYGGYMVDWIAGHTDRFRCLVSHDGVFDLVSEYGATEELWFPEWEFRGPYWQNPELYRKWSPSSYVQSFKTPTLVVQGELDFRVPVEQGLGMFTALQRRGIESRLLYFPDEGHWVLKPRNSLLWYRTVLDWIDAHSKAQHHND